MNHKALRYRERLMMYSFTRTPINRDSYQLFMDTYNFTNLKDFQIRDVDGNK